jgi:hypothetical protein
MKKSSLASVAWLAWLATRAVSSSATITEDFSTDPLQHGWHVFGNTNLFAWNPTNQNLEVTWDSTQPNSYFHHPLGVSLTRYDDFALEFDLRLASIASDVEPGKTGPLQIGIGLLNLPEATSTNFMRGVWGGAPDVVEFGYYTAGFYDYGGIIYPSPASAVPSFIPGNEPHHYAPVFVSAFEATLPLAQAIHVRLAYSSATQAAVLTLAANGQPLSQFAPLQLNDPNNSQFTPTDTFHVDTFSVSSYSSAGDPFDSVRAQGTIDNLTITVQRQPITWMTGGLTTNGLWEAQFFARSNWVYTLERSVDLQTWDTTGASAAGADALTTLVDTNAPPARSFYRVHAE